MIPATFPYSLRWEPDDTKETPLREVPRAKALPRTVPVAKPRRERKRRDVRGIVDKLKARHLLKTIDEIAEKRHVTREELLDGHEPHMIEARTDVWEWLAVNEWSANSIGKLFDYDHTTVLPALRARAAKGKR